ncbi:hypothetical protein QBC44DRAFT_335931 [Cladorrhinum sp. PSN332]|nr:hypothetical protein QBC44DRAFT_335931 [Cladorrhinum sp. PSN332]
MASSTVELKPLSKQPYVEFGQADRSGEVSAGEAVHQGTWGRIWTSLVHVPPLSISVFLVFISHRRWFWFEEKGPDWFETAKATTTLGVFDLASVDSIKNLLQLAAKIYEILVVASLGDITVKVFKRRLTALPRRITAVSCLIRPD